MGISRQSTSHSFGRRQYQERRRIKDQQFFLQQLFERCSGMLDWSVERLSQRCGVHVASILSRGKWMTANDQVVCVISKGNNIN